MKKPPKEETSSPKDPMGVGAEDVIAKINGRNKSFMISIIFRILYSFGQKKILLTTMTTK